MKRREFLISGLGAFAGFTVASRSGLAQLAPQRRKVVVIGAGLSGLAAAYELAKLDFDLTILEAQSRSGGRVLTLRNFGEPGLYAEAGAARIPVDHDLTLRYVREFGLPLVPFYPTRGKFVHLHDGRSDAVNWNKFEDAVSMVVPLQKREHWLKIRGGNDQLPSALAARLEGKIRYASPVVRIEQNSSGVTVKFRDKGGIQSTAGDFAICAIPTTTLAKVEFAPTLSTHKAAVIRSMEYDPASRIFIETKRRTWRDQDLNGFGFSEDDAAEIWESTLGQPGTHGILQTYLRGGFSDELSRKVESERIESQLVKLNSMFPALRPSFVKGISKCWRDDPWVMGAWAHPDKQKKDIAMKAEGRIFFTGEHLSDHGSWMQGALQSALRVVTEVTSVPSRI